MLKGKLIHPEILHSLGINGHGARILIADGNYPFSTGSPANAKKVFLNLMPGMVKITDVLDALISAIPIESADVMVPETGERQAIHDEFEKILPLEIKVKPHIRFEFYDLAKDGSTCLVIATGEQRRFANLLLTIGVIRQS